MKWVNRQMEIILMIFPKKCLFGANRPFGLKMAHPHNFGLALRVFFKFCTMDGANSAQNLYQWLIRKNSCLGQLVHLGSRMSHAASQLWVYCKDCFTILHNEMGQERHGNNINSFSERDLTQSNLVILKQKWYGFLLALNLLSDFFINFTQSKGPRGT